mgnify:CR=1 FL=1
MTEFRKFSAALDDAKLTLQTAAATDNSDSATARRDAAEAIRRRCADGDLRRTADKFAAKLEATDDVTEPTFLATLQTARRVRDAAAARVPALFAASSSTSSTSSCTQRFYPTFSTCHSP